MTAYRRGADKERRVRTKLEQDGWFVIRSAGSKTIIDLVAFKDRSVMFVQVGTARKSRKEREMLVDLADDFGAIPVMVVDGMKFEFLREAA